MADVTRVPKSEMVDMVQKSFSSLAGKDITKKDAEAALNAVVESISTVLREGKSVSFLQLGTFLIKERPARKGRNPQSGKEIDIPASKTAAFKVSSSLKVALNK